VADFDPVPGALPAQNSDSSADIGTWAVPIYANGPNRRNVNVFQRMRSLRTGPRCRAEKTWCATRYGTTSHMAIGMKVEAMEFALTHDRFHPSIQLTSRECRLLRFGRFWRMVIFAIRRR
jgi:hypothetical protein